MHTARSLMDLIAKCAHKLGCSHEDLLLDLIQYRVDDNPDLHGRIKGDLENLIKGEETDEDLLKDGASSAILKMAKNALRQAPEKFTCGAGDWRMVCDGKDFFLANANDQEDVLKISVKVEIDLID